MGGATPYAGRLEICHNGQWATVCNNHFTSVSASVICKQLLGENASKLINLALSLICTGQSVMLIFFSIVGAVESLYTQHFGQGSSSSILDDLVCTGTESSISQCTYTVVRDFSAAGCYHSHDVQMICYGILLPL